MESRRHDMGKADDLSTVANSTARGLRLKRPHQTDASEIGSSKRRPTRSTYTNVHMILVTMDDKSRSPFMKTKIEGLKQDMAELDEVAAVWQGYPTTRIEIGLPTTVANMIAAMRQSDESDVDTLHVVCYAGRAGMVKGMYRWLDSTGNVSFNAENLLRQIYAETELHVVFILDCYYRSPSVPAVNRNRGGHISVIARGPPRQSLSEMERQTFSFLARFTKYLANLSIPSWNAGRRRPYEILDFYNHAMSDRLRFTNPKIDTLKNEACRNHLVPLIPNDVLDKFLRTGEVRLVDNDENDAGGWEAEDIIRDDKEYSQVHVLIIKWRESYFPSDAGLEESLDAVIRYCEMHYWVPERFDIQGISKFDCRRNLLRAVSGFVSRYGQTPANLLVITYVGHGDMDLLGNWTWKGNHEIRWNDIQETVQNSCEADILFLLQAFDSLGALFKWKATLSDHQLERASRQEIIAARGMEGLCFEDNHVLLPERWFELLETYRHKDAAPTTKTLHDRLDDEDELLWSHMSSFRVPLARSAACIPLRPCYRALHENVEALIANSLRDSPLTQLRVVIVRHCKNSGPLLQSDVFRCWRWGRDTVSECKATYARVYGLAKHRLLLKAGPLFPHDTDTLSDVQRHITKRYTTETNYVVFEAFFGLSADDIVRRSCH